MSRQLGPIFLYCDGAFIQGSSQAGYGLVVTQGSTELYSDYGKVEAHSSMEAELIAMLHAVKYIQSHPDNQSYVIISDCKEVVECMVGNSMRKKGLELWHQIQEMSQSVSYKVGHINKKLMNPNDRHVQMNKRADALAYKGATQIAEEFFFWEEAQSC